ncbi:MAG: serine hydrolase [Natronohydrobacter sp.]|nr:serine hydrolase [Natronohydrobacter sp.]
MIILDPIPETCSPELRAHADRVLRRYRLPGLGLGKVGMDGGMQIAVAGLRARGNPEPISLTDRWHIGSITKSMTALVLARLVARGLTRFDAPLGDLAALRLHPDLARQSLRALLAHRAGLAANPARAACFGPDPCDSDQPEGPLRDRVLAPWLLKPLRPGRFRYSNLGYMLAGHIAEQLGGAPWKQLMRNELAGPLGLDSLGFGPPPAPNPMGHGSILSCLLTRRGYGPRWGAPIEPDAAFADLSPAFGPAGLVHLSLADLLRYGAAIAVLAKSEDGIVPAEIFRDLISSRDYAGGWVIEAKGLRHNGSNGLWVADLRIDRARNEATAMVTNSGSLGAFLAAGAANLRRTPARS